MGKGKFKIYNSEEGYNLYASKYDESLKFLDSFEKGEFYNICGDIRGKKVLDLGAGTGRLTPWLLMGGAKLASFDLSEGMLRILKRKYPKSETILGDVLDLSGIEEGSYDIVTAAFLIVHIAEKNLGKFFNEVYRVLKPGGIFVLSNINQRKPPKLQLENDEIQIKSFYHMPKKITQKLEEAFFLIENEKLINDGDVWINQIILAKKI